MEIVPQAMAATVIIIRLRWIFAACGTASRSSFKPGFYILKAGSRRERGSEIIKCINPDKFLPDPGKRRFDKTFRIFLHNAEKVKKK